MLPHFWHRYLIDGLAFSMLVWLQKGDQPDTALVKVSQEAYETIFLADEPQTAYLQTAYQTEKQEEQKRYVLRAAIAQLRNASIQMQDEFDRVTHTSSSSYRQTPSYVMDQPTMTSLEWNGMERFVRSAEIENAATVQYRTTDDHERLSRIPTPPPPPPVEEEPTVRTFPYHADSDWMR